MEQPRPGGTTFVIVVKTSRPGKYASTQCLENNSAGVFLAPHLSPATSSPVFTNKRKLQNVSMVNNSFYDHWLLETLRNISFSERLWLVFTRKCCRRDKYATCGLWVTSQYLSHNQISRLTWVSLGKILSGEVSRSLRYCRLPRFWDTLTLFQPGRGAD